MTIYFANPGDNLQAKASALVAGDTLILNDGTYTVTGGTQGLRIIGVSGTSLQPITIKAANDGKAIIDGAAGAGGNFSPIFVTNANYITIQGIVARNSWGSVVQVFSDAPGGGSGACDHITLQRITAHGAGNGNFHCIDITSNNNQTSVETTNVLVEDCAAWGPGRYMFLAYSSNTVTFRRCYAYWNGITDTAQEPRACFGVYGAKNVTLENCIGRNAQPYQTETFNNYFQAVYHTSAGASYISDNTKILGCIFYDNWNGYWLNDDAGTPFLMQDTYIEVPLNSATWTNKNKGEGFDINSSNASASTIRNCTFRNCDVGYRVQAGTGTQTFVNNALVGSTTLATLGDPGHSYTGFFGNTSNGTTLVGTDLTSNPGYNTTTYGRGGALFVANSSPYKGTGSGGADIGANVLYQYVNGSLTGTALWPWPMEGRVVTELGISPTYETSGTGGPWKTLSGIYGLNTLALYGTPAFASTVTTATKLVANVSGATSTGYDTRCSTSTGYSEIYPQGTSTAWQSLGSLGAPSGKGYLLDNTSLEGATIVSGNWTPTVRLRVNGGSGGLVANLYCRAYKRSSGGTYTAIGTMSMLSQSIANGTSSNYTFVAAALSSMSFVVGDKLYIDFWANITSNSSGSSTAGLRLDLSTSLTSGSTNQQVLTPGYTFATIQTKDLKTRLRLLATNVRDIGLRLLLQPNGIRNLSTRLVLRIRPTLTLSTRLNLRPPVVSTQDAAIYKTQIVKAYTAAGVFIDVVRDAPLLAGFKEAVNTAISPIEVVLPRAFDNFDVGGAGGPGTIAQGNIWKYFLFGPGLPVTGKMRYQGVVDAFAPSIADNGAETVTVTLMPQSSALVDHGIGGQQLFTATDPVTIFNWWFNNNDPITGHPYAYPLTLDGTNLTSSGVSVTYPFLNMTLADIFAVLVLTFPPNWFFRCNPDLSTTLNIAPVTAQHNFMLGQHCAVPQYKQDWTNLKNVIFATGGTPAGFGPETVTVLRTSGGVFVANFENAHTGNWNITIDPSFLIATEGTTGITGTGAQTITPRSMTNIVPGIRLKIVQISGTGTTEVVTVTTTTSTTFTATFASTHSGTWSIQLDPAYTVNTTCSTPIGGGNEATCSPASLTNIFQGVKLLVGMGGNNQQALTSVKQGSDLATFGERLLLINESRIADQPTLDIFAQGYLSLLDQVVIRTKVRVVDYRGDVQGGLGTDIETIQVGDTCKITDPFANTGTLPSASVWDTAVWDQSLWDYSPGASFNQVAVISALTYGFDYVDLEISTLQPNQDAAFMRLRNQLQALSLTQQ